MDVNNIKIIQTQVEYLSDLFKNKLEIIKEKEIFCGDKLLLIERLDNYYIHIENDSIEYGVLCRFLGETSILEKYEWLLTEQCDLLQDYKDFWLSVTGFQETTKTLHYSCGIEYDRIELFAYKIELNEGKVMKVTLEREF
ncbi:MAG TPA: hypothetical protein PLP33_16255 [Leptospiraceae bacterium]|nr:hypothetical protein [Leptospiraceae bacterium]